MRHVILPVHGFHFSKVAKGHNIKEKAPKINMIVRSFLSLQNQANRILFTNKFLVFHIYQSNTKVFTKS